MKSLTLTTIQADIDEHRISGRECPWGRALTRATGVPNCRAGLVYGYVPRNEFHPHNFLTFVWPVEIQSNIYRYDRHQPIAPKTVTMQVPDECPVAGER